MAKTSFRVGDLHLGVQSNSTSVLDLLRATLPAHSVEDPATPPNFSIYEGATALAGARPAYRVFTDCVHVFTSPSRSRAVAVVVGLLANALPVELPAHVLELDAVAIVGEHAAVLAPWTYRYGLPAGESALRRRGLRLLERLSVLVDTRTRELIIPAWRLSVEAAHTPAGEETSPPGALTPAGRLPIRAWLFDGAPEPTPVSSAQAVARGMGVAYRRRGAAANLAPLATLVSGLDVRLAVGVERIGAVAAEILNGRGIPSDTTAI